MFELVLLFLYVFVVISFDSCWYCLFLWLYKVKLGIFMDIIDVEGDEFSFYNKKLIGF